MEQQLVSIGRAWLFGNEVDTDNMFPGFALKLPIAEAARHVFYALRPGWANEVKSGDIIVGGKAFGIGSSRPVALLLKHLRVGGIVAEEFNSLFFRNCINYGLPLMVIPGVLDVIREGDQLRVDFEQGLIRVERTGQMLKGERYPQLVLEILRAGGVMAQLESRGLVLPMQGVR
ncbi:MAG: 3-isopropylmalate dehydratase [Betaproteobacteria bacterium]|nr:3-isopropylmalate dehydratase [Betaproteobacteria bacterium]